jgi:hypothetical protein
VIDPFQLLLVVLFVELIGVFRYWLSSAWVICESDFETLLAAL